MATTYCVYANHICRIRGQPLMGLSRLLVSCLKSNNTRSLSLSTLSICKSSNVYEARRMHHQVPADAYVKTFQRSTEKPEEFWAEAAENLTWFKKWDSVLDTSKQPFNKWFVGGELNTCYNAIDRHVEAGRGDQTALIHDSPVTNSIKHITYKELLKQVRDFAGALVAQGVQKGDVVLIYMPMIPEAVVAMMACARVGAIHNLVFGGFAAKELSTRISHSQPKVIVSSNCGIEPNRIVPYKPLLDEAIEISDWKPKRCIVFNRAQFEQATLMPGRDLDWNDAISKGKPGDCVPVLATDPIYMLYTSGTTGLPKGVVRPSGGHAVALNWTMPNIYGVHPGSVWWAASDLGWVVGHSYIAYAPLLIGATSIIFEGKPVGTPDAGAFFRALQQHEAQGLFLAPTALRAIRAADPDGEKIKPFLPLEKFDSMYVAGEHCDHETMKWIQDILKKPVLDHWWQTESGWALTATCRGLGMDLYPKPGLTGKPVPGWNVQVLRPDGSETEADELGEIFIKLPLPPGSMSTLFKNDEGFKQIYFSRLEGYYNTMDSGIRDPDGYISVLSRTDDVINVAGHRLSCGVLEEAILECSDVVEAAVIGVPDQLKGYVPLGLCVVRPDTQLSADEIQKQVIKIVRDVVGPVAAFKLVVVVPKLPKTRSGKVARSSIASMAAGKPYKIPITIDDASVYPQILEKLQELGLAQGL